MEHILSADGFELRISLKIFGEDIKYSTNTIMYISVQSNNFGAIATMDIDVKDFAIFAKNLCMVYETLSGEARIEEPYGLHMYINFKGNCRGHIAINGIFQDGNEQKLEFQNEIDQTYLRAFCYELRDEYLKYLNI